QNETERHAIGDLERFPGRSKIFRQLGVESVLAIHRQTGTGEEHRLQRLLRNESDVVAACYLRYRIELESQHKPAVADAHVQHARRRLHISAVTGNYCRQRITAM